MCRMCFKRRRESITMDQKSGWFDSEYESHLLRRDSSDKRQHAPVKQSGRAFGGIITRNVV